MLLLVMMIGAVVMVMSCLAVLVLSGGDFKHFELADLLPANWGAGKKYGLGDYRVSGIVPDVVQKAGSRAYEVLLKKGVRGPSGSSSRMSIKPKGFPATACRWKFRLWFDDDFPWTESGSHRVGGKLAGLHMGSGAASGGNYSTTGASLRLVFHRDRGAGAYLYPQLRRARSGGDPSWAELDQSAALRSVSHVATGVHIFSGTNLRFRAGTWNDIELFAKLNTPGKFDGLLELSVNGDRRRLDSVRYRYTSGLQIEEAQIAPFFGGGDQSYAPPNNVRLWYTGLEFYI